MKLDHLAVLFLNQRNLKFLKTEARLLFEKPWDNFRSKTPKYDLLEFGSIAAGI